MTPAKASTAPGSASDKSGRESASTAKMSWWQILKTTGSDWVEDKAPKLAASLALYAMLSLAPLLVILTKIVGVAVRDEPADKVSGFMNSVMPGVGGEAMKEMIQRASQHGTGVVATVLAVVMAAFGATGVFGEFQDSMNTIWEVKPKPNRGIWGFIRTRFLSFAMVLGIAFLFMISTVGIAVVTSIGKWIGGESQVFVYIVTTVVSLAAMTLLFAAIFKVLPDVNVQWRDVWVGAVVTAVLFEIGKHALSWYTKGSATTVFGAAGFLAAMLLWIYYSAQILFFGAEFTQVWARAHGRVIQPSKDAVQVTEEDRAQEGRASPERVERKTAEDEGRRPATAAMVPAYQPAPATGGFAVMQSRLAPQRQGGGSAARYVWAAGGVALGAALGAMGVEYLMHDPKKPARKHAASVRLDRRLAAVEQRVGSVARLKGYLEDMHVKERIDDVERRVRHATTNIRAAQSNRPKWLVRLGELIAGA